jgi:NADPH:quinone reductase-like Zn-dependent oxidoreductase
MQRIVIHRPGGYDRLRLETQPTPAPGPGEVRVRVAACGVNYADVVVRLGLYASAKKYVGWPITPGFEYAGVVDTVGAGVTTLQPGAAVLGVTRFGGYATHVVVPAHQVFLRPDTMSVAQAAGFPAVFMTAYHALFNLAHVREGERVLLHSAAGGVGVAALQLCRVAGARVTGVVGREPKVAVAQAFGADVVIDTSREDLWARAAAAAPDGYDVALDANGVSTLWQSYRHLRPTGRLVVYGFASMLPRGGGRLNYLRMAWDYLRTPRFDPLRMTGSNKSVLAFNLSFLFDRADLLREAMERLLAWAAAGRIRAADVTTFPLAEAAAAHRAIESGTTTGKLVLLTGEGDA